MNKANICNRLSFLSLFIVIVLLPAFFLPFANFPIETSKGLILVIGLAASVVFWAIARFYDGKIILPKSVCLPAAGLIVLVFFLSALFSSSPQASFFGIMFDTGSFWFIFCGFILMLMTSIVFREPKYSKLLLSGVILSGAAVLIFQGAHLFSPAILSLGILNGKTDNVLGSWNALGLYAGLCVLISVLVVEFFSTTVVEKWLLRATGILSLMFVAAANFTLVWIALGIFSLLIFVYKVSTTSKKIEDEKQNSRFPAVALVIVILALLFTISGPFLGGILPSRLGIVNNEISLSLADTVQVTKAVLRMNPVFGIGPNRFEEAFALHKPAFINATPFWDASFSSGSGLLPTLVSTTGLLGILSWLIFFILFVRSGIKSFFSGIRNGKNIQVMAFFVLSFYLFVSTFFYSSGAVIFLLALAFAGVSIGLSSSGRAKGEIAISFLGDPRKSFVYMLTLVLIIIATAAGVFVFLGRVASVPYYGKALIAPTIPIAEVSISRALSLYQSDLYWRTYAQIYLVKLSTLASKGNSLTDEEKASMQESLNRSVAGGQLAAKFDEKNYLNFQALGSLYQNLASIGVKNANENALDAYKAASGLNPLNPQLKLNMAISSDELGKTQDAKDFANAALVLKPDYIDATIVLSQIAKSEGDNANALLYARSALLLAENALSQSPQDKNLLSYVDYLKNLISSYTALPQDVTKPAENSDKTKGAAKKTAN